MKNSIVVNNDELMELVVDKIKDSNITFKIKGTSMKPFFKDGVTVVTLDNRTNFKKHDVVLFKLNNNYILHRIVKIKDNYIKTQGDALTKYEYIKREDIVGVVKFHEHHDHLILCDDKKYVFKVRLWVLLRPFRRVLNKLVR